MPDKPHPKPKTHIGLADLLPVIGAVVIASTPGADSPSGPGVSPAQNFGWALDSALGAPGSAGWNDPGNGGAANLQIGVTEFIDNVFSLEGILIGGATLGARHYIKHNTSLSRHVVLSTKHHKFTLGS